MENNLSFKEAKLFIESYKRFLIVSHAHPDGDAISSTLSMYWLLNKLGKEVVLYNEDEVPSSFLFLPNSHLIGKEIKEAEAVIYVDCADQARAGSIQFEGKPILNIDHHPTNQLFGMANICHSQAAATVEVIYDFIQTLNISLDHEVSLLLYTGLLTDTGGLRHSNTTSKVLRMAADLVAHGVNHHKLYYRLFEKVSFATIQLLKRTLSRITVIPECGMTYTYITLEDLVECKGTLEEAEHVLQYIRNLEGTEIGILFKQLDLNQIKVSLRSSEKIDVSRIAQHFGGGGHVRASGFSITGELTEMIASTVTEVKKLI